MNVKNTENIKLFGECECGKLELTEGEIKEGKKNGCVMCNKCFMPKIVEKIILTNKEEWGAWKIVSEMLDNPDKYGIYPTSKCYQKLYDFVVAQKEKAKQEGAEEIIELIEGNNRINRRMDADEIEDLRREVRKYFKPIQ